MWDFTGKVIARKINKLEFSAVGERQNRAVEAIFMEVEEAEMIEKRKRSNGSPERKRRERKGNNTASGGALDANPRSRGGSTSI